MKITQEADYALRVVFFLSNIQYGEIVDAKSMAESEKIPGRFLLKILRKLVKAEIIRSFRGVNGGYALNMYPEDITVKSVIEAIDGPIYMNRCLYDPMKCNLNRADVCSVHIVLNKIQDKLIEEMKKINFKEISEGTIKKDV